MTPTEFSIAHPDDTGMIDVCGADASLPNLLAEFSKW
jgi:60 kDa SS-A/Ro ribonucleoprotein